MSTKRIFDDTYIHLKEVNKNYLESAGQFDAMNGLPAQSYYEVCSQYWNLIYNQPHKVNISARLDQHSSDGEDDGLGKRSSNRFNPAQSLNITGITVDNEFSGGNRNHFQFDFGIPFQGQNNADIGGAKSGKQNNPVLVKLKDQKRLHHDSRAQSYMRAGSGFREGM